MSLSLKRLLTKINEYFKIKVQIYLLSFSLVILTSEGTVFSNRMKLDLTVILQHEIKFGSCEIKTI
jgi:hypothetical protein